MTRLAIPRPIRRAQRSLRDRLPNFRYALLEQDHSSRDELASVQLSRDAFVGYDNVNWSR